MQHCVIVHAATTILASTEWITTFTPVITTITEVNTVRNHT
jgi:hypothetical protein